MEQRQRQRLDAAPLPRCLTQWLDDALRYALPLFCFRSKPSIPADKEPSESAGNPSLALVWPRSRQRLEIGSVIPAPESPQSDGILCPGKWRVKARACFLANLDFLTNIKIMHHHGAGSPKENSSRGCENSSKRAADWLTCRFKD